MQAGDVISLVSKIRERVNRLIVSEMEKHGLEGVATSHGDILHALFQKQKLTMAEIAESIGKDKSTVTVLVEKLARLGYIARERDAKDSRVVYVSLTQKGEELRPAFQAISAGLLDTFYRGITDEEKEELLRILKKVYGNL